MSEPDLRAAIDGPARIASLVVEPGLVDVLVGEVSRQPRSLPLMSHALAETWQRRERRMLTLDGYRASGGMHEAVALSAEQVYAQVSDAQKTMLRDLMLRLVSSRSRGRAVRSRLPRRLVVTDAEHDAVVNLLVESRLVTSHDVPWRSRTRLSPPRGPGCARGSMTTSRAAALCTTWRARPTLWTR